MNPPQTPPPPNFSQKPKFHIFFFLKPSLREFVKISRITMFAPGYKIDKELTPDT